MFQGVTSCQGKGRRRHTTAARFTLEQVYYLWLSRVFTYIHTQTHTHTYTHKTPVSPLDSQTDRRTDRRTDSGAVGERGLGRIKEEAGETGSDRRGDG